MLANMLGVVREAPQGCCAPARPVTCVAGSTPTTTNLGGGFCGIASITDAVQLSVTAFTQMFRVAWLQGSRVPHTDINIQSRATPTPRVSDLSPPRSGVGGPQGQPQPGCPAPQAQAPASPASPWNSKSQHAACPSKPLGMTKGCSAPALCPSERRPNLQHPKSSCMRLGRPPRRGGACNEPHGIPAQQVQRYEPQQSMHSRLQASSSDGPSQLQRHRV